MKLLSVIYNFYTEHFVVTDDNNTSFTNNNLTHYYCKKSRKSTEPHPILIAKTTALQLGIFPYS